MRRFKCLYRHFKTCLSKFSASQCLPCVNDEPSGSEHGELQSPWETRRPDSQGGYAQIVSLGENIPVSTLGEHCHSGSHLANLECWTVEVGFIITRRSRQKIQYVYIVSRQTQSMTPHSVWLQVVTIYVLNANG